MRLVFVSKNSIDRNELGFVMYGWLIVPSKIPVKHTNSAALSSLSSGPSGQKRARRRGKPISKKADLYFSLEKVQVLSR